MREKRLSLKARSLRLLLLYVHRGDERAALFRKQRLRLLGITKLPSAVRVAARFDHAARGVDGVEAMLRVGRECPVKGRELADDIDACLGGLILKYGAFRISIKLNVAVVRCGKPRYEHLDPRPVSGHPRALKKLLPVQAVDGREQVRGAFDESHQRAHRQRNAAFFQVAANAVERREQHELLMDEPREPIARDLGTSVGRGQRRGRCASKASPTSTRGALHHTTALMLFDDVKFLFDDRVHDVEFR